MATTAPTTLSFGGNPATGEAPTTYNVNPSASNGVGSQVTTSAPVSTTTTRSAPTTTTASTAPVGLNYNAGVAANAANPPQYGTQGQLLNPSPAGTAAEPVTQSTPSTAPAASTTTPTVPTTPQATTAQTALAQLQASGAPPQDSATASAAVNAATSNTPTFYKPTTPVPGYNAQTVFNAQGQPLTYQQYLAAGGKSDFSNVQAGSPPSQTTPQSTTPQTTTNNTPANISQALAADPGYQAILAAATQAQSTATSSENLEQQYTDLMNQYNIPAINTQLVNMNAVINGTETDIENEAKAAGGFVTQSQVDALAAARNKTLIQQYNTLQQTKTDAMNSINTMIGLAEQDRTFAQTAANNQLQITEQEADYQQKFVANQQADYNAVISSVGYAGLYQSLNALGGQNSVSLAEQVMGMAPGELQQIANTPSLADQKNAIDLQLAQTQLKQANVNLQQSNAEEPLNVEQKQAAINQSNASAASSAASAAQTKTLTDFENANGGLTPDQESTQVQGFSSKAADYITQLATGKISWSAAWNALHTEYPQASTQTLDNALDATNYRNSTTGG